MVYRPRSITLAACLCAARGFAQSGTIPPNSMLDGTRSAQMEPPKPALSPENRGDIFMARKMFREAAEAYQEGPKDSAVLLNKTGIAYHQMLDLSAAEKYYRRAIKMNPEYSEAINNLGTIFYTRKQGL